MDGLRRPVRLSSILACLRNDSRRTAGALLLAAGAIALMGIITAETLYPDYSTSDNMISDLGATEPPDSVIIQPSSNIFSGTMVLTGSLTLLAVWCLRSHGSPTAFVVPLGLFGLGVLGVGVFNGSWGTVHALFALTTFVAGGVAAIMTYKVAGPPMKHLSAVLGAISLFTLLQYFALGDSSPLLELGEGGVERWIAYPVMLWTTAFGGYLIGTSQAPSESRPEDEARAPKAR